MTLDGQEKSEWDGFRASTIPAIENENLPVLLSDNSNMFSTRA